jgi:DNA-binding NtrC family response regulator
MLLHNAVPRFFESPERSAKPLEGRSDPETDPPDRSLNVGVSGAWRRLLAQANMAAPYGKLASIEGEPGSGKQTLARYLWSISPVADSRFERHDAREWLLVADPASLSGFVYLDRVDLLASPGQGLLLGALKTLQDRQHDRQASRHMIVVSSQASLRQLAGQGQMLPDLAFRLSAVRFAIPPLRARKEDIVPLSQHLLERICARYQHKAVALSPAALGRLMQHDWPGNVRELASVLEGALLEASEDMIRPGDLPLDKDAQSAALIPVFPEAAAARLSLDDCIHRHVQYVLDLNHGNKLRAARQLGISRSTLYRILGSESILSRQVCG